MAAESFAGQSGAIVAVIPEASLPTDELEPAGLSYRVHATSALQSVPRLTLMTTYPDALAYRWDGVLERWQFVGGEVTPGAVTI